MSFDFVGIDEEEVEGHKHNVQDDVSRLPYLPQQAAAQEIIQFERIICPLGRTEIPPAASNPFFPTQTKKITGPVNTAGGGITNPK